MKRKMMALFLAGAVGMSALTGCGGNSGTTPTTKGSDSGNETTKSGGSGEQKGSESADNNFNETGYPIVNDRITLNVMFAVRDSDTFAKFDEMPALQRLEEQTNIDLEWDMVKGSDWSTKLNLMFASGDYPDLILASNGNGAVDDEEYGVTQQLLVPLEDYIEKYMPTYTERAEAEKSDPRVGLTASDGHVYSVGNLVGQNICTSAHTFINQEWLNALGLEVPTTVDELTEVLRAFKTQDPNGNGQADEIPLEMGLDTGFTGFRYILPMFGVPADNSYWIYLDENKQVQFAPTQDGFRKALEWLHQMYEEGLTDPELLSQDSNTVDSKLKEGNVGFFTLWRLIAMGMDDGVASNSVCIMPPSAEGTNSLMHRTLEIASPAAFVPRTNQNIPATMRLLDTMLETETQFSLYYGEKDATDGTGWQYNENGKIDSLDTNSADVYYYLGCNTLFFAPGEYISSTFNMPPQRIEKTTYCKDYDAAGHIQKYANKYLDIAPLTAEQVAKAGLTQTDINSTVWEGISNFVSKGVTDDSWNEFVGKFETMKVGDYVKMYQDAIDTMDIE